MNKKQFSSKNIRFNTAIILRYLQGNIKKVQPDASSKVLLVHVIVVYTTNVTHWLMTPDTHQEKGCDKVINSYE